MEIKPFLEKAEKEIIKVFAATRVYLDSRDLVFILFSKLTSSKNVKDWEMKIQKEIEKLKSEINSE